MTKTATSLEFDEQTHTYTLEGRVLPSVTQILDAVGLIDKQWYTEEASQRGTNIALATELLDQGNLDRETLETDFPGYVGYVDAWQDFLTTSAAEVIWIERAVFDRALQYAGTLDRLVRITGVNYVLDIKTGSPCSWHAIQTAAYASTLWEAWPRDLGLSGGFGRMAVYLKEDGTFKVVQHGAAGDEVGDYDVWRACVALYHWMKNEGMT